MTVSAIDAWSRQSLVQFITAYQRYISPHKGFSCAHRILYGQTSCSQYIKQAILEQGLWHARPVIQQRFQACKAANQILQARRQQWLAMTESDDSQPTEPNAPTKKREVASGSSDCNDASGLCDLVYCGSDLSNCSAGLDGCDMGALDCSGLDCGGLDCGGLNCDGCSF